MKRFYFISLLLAAMLAGFIVESANEACAQQIANGFYRTYNYGTNRYVTLRDGYGHINYTATTADMGAIQTIRGYERVVSNPASVIYLTLQDPSKSNYWDCIFQTQGTSTYKIISNYIKLQYFATGTHAGQYTIYASKSGMTQYLSDSPRGTDSESETDIHSQVVTNQPDYKYWTVQRLGVSDDSYFGIQPDITYGGKYYKSFYADFPFSFHSSGMKARYVSFIDSERSIAVWKELSGEMPQALPVFIECSANTPSGNRLDIHLNSASAPSDSQMKGVFFCRHDVDTDNPHFAATVNNTKTMRFLGLCKDGKLGLISSSEAYVPANTAYVIVPEGTASELSLMTPEEYEKAKVVPVSGITLNTTSAQIIRKQTLQLSATVLPSYATNPVLSWSASGDAVSVDQNGLVTALKVGSATVTASSTDDSGVSASCQITVLPVSVTGISLSTSQVELHPSQQDTISATVTPADADDTSFTWTSANPSIATVQDGVITAVGLGTTIISATTTDGGFTASCSVLVSPILATSISVSDTSVSLHKGDSYTLTATVLPENATNPSVSWTSSNPDIVSVADGILTANALGSAVITVSTTDGSGLSASCNVTVSAILVESITLNYTTYAIDLSQSRSLQLIATVLPENATDRSLTWSSSDRTVAFVDSEGLIQFHQQGFAVITATANDGSGISATCTLTSADEITAARASQTHTAATIYDFLGRKIDNTSTLPQGIYIINGRKTLVR